MADPEQDYFTDGHWEEPNVIGWYRGQMLQSLAGEQAFNGDEIQSDFGQDFRDQGPVGDREAHIQELQAKIEAMKTGTTPLGLVYRIAAGFNPEYAEMAFESDRLTDGSSIFGSDYFGFERDIRSYFLAQYPQAQSLVDDIAAIDAQISSLRGEERLAEGDPRAVQIDKLQNDARAAEHDLYRLYNDVMRADDLALAKSELNILQVGNKRGVPSNPMIRSTAQWVSIVMRRMVRQAVMNGADGITLSPGFVQNQRWGRSAQLTKARVKVLDEAGTRGVTFYRRSKRPGLSDEPLGEVIVAADGTIEQSTLPRHYGVRATGKLKLADAVTPEAAEKIMATGSTEFREPFHMIEFPAQQQVELGGRAFRETYDKLYPSILEKVLRALDPSITREERMMKGLLQNESQGWPVFSKPFVYFPLTEKAKQAVLNEGQPLFSVTRPPEMPDPEAEAELQALGQADPYAGIISVAMDTIFEEAARRGVAPETIAAQTARHEALELFHGLGLFTDPEWKLLTSTAKRQGWVTPELRRNYTELYGETMTAEELEETIIKEAIADKFAAFLSGDIAIAQGKVNPGDKVIDLRIGELFNRLKDFLEKIANYARGMGFERWEQVFMKLERGEFAQRYEQDVAGHTAKNLEGEIAGVVRAGSLPDAPGFSPTPGATHPVIGLAETIHEFRRALGLPLAQGRLNPVLARAARRRGSRLYGQYNFGTGVARVAVSNDFDTISHEGGHHMEVRYGAPLQALMQANTAELGAMAAAIGYGQMDLREGFAEFFRKYVTNPQTAQAQAPGMYADFESMLARDDATMLGHLQNLQNAYLAFLTGSPMDVKIANQTLLIGRENAFDRFMQEAEDEGLLDTIGDRMHWMYYSVIGRNHGWWMATKRLLDIIETRIGRRVDIRALDNPNVLIRRLSHTTAWALQDLKRGIALRRRPDGGGVSMHDVFRVAFGGTDKAQWNPDAMQKFGDYLISRRAVRLFVQHNPALRSVVLNYVRANPQLGFLLPALPNNPTSELEYPPTLEPLTHHLQALIQHTAESPQFAQAAALYYEFNHDILDFLYEKELLSKEQRDALYIDNDYAPFQRDMSDRVLNAGARTSQRPEVNGPLANKYGVYRSIHGSMRDIINPAQSTIQFIYEMRLRAAFNDVLQAMDRLATRAGNGGGEIFERLPAHEAQRHEVQIRETLRSAARGAGLSDTDTAAMLATVESYLGPNATAELFSLKQAGEKGERIVWFYSNGKAVPARLADGSMGLMMFEAFTTLGRRTPDLWMKLIGIPAATVRWGVTNAFEFIVRNLWVDAIASSVNSPYARPFLTQARGLREVLGGGEYFRMYNRYAGMMGGETVQSLSDQSLERDFEALRSQREHIIRRPKGIVDFLKMVMNFGELSETATRVGVFRNAMISNMADGLTRYQAAFEAAHAAHDVMDFSRHGSKTELIRRAIPFWGAATQGIDRYLRTLTGANDHGSAVTTWMRYQFGGRQLTPHEQRSLGQAARAWFWTTMIMGGASAFFWWLGSDDEDLDDIPDRIRATHWRVSIDGILYFIPKDFRSFLDISDEKHLPLRLPKPFEMTWVANAMERGLDAAYKGDKSAALRYLNDFWTIIQPPDSIPALDLPYGLMHGKDDFAHRDIIPYWEQQLERADQYGPYTSEMAKKIGNAVNISPYYVDYLVRGLGASVGRDAQTAWEFAHNWVTGTGPEPGIEEFPIARRFMYNVARSSESISEFYDIYRNQEGIVDWFWDTLSADARSYAAAKGSYKRRKDDLSDPAGAQLLYDKLSPDQKVYAVLSVDFKGADSEFRNLHPIENASEGISVANNMMKEVLSGNVKTEVADEPIKLTPQAEHYLRNELGHIRRGMAQNALHILGVPGWANQKMADLDARLDVIKAANEPVYDELIRRLEKKHFLEMKHLQQVWPQVRERVLADRENAALGDLVVGGEIGAR
jgi:hypothetical protein